MGETLHSLGIYWPKLVAQMVNFAIVLFILWKFAYRPVLKMLEERRQKVAEAMINAQKAREELARTEAQRQQVLAETNAQANKLIEEARAAAAKVREDDTQKAIREAEQIVSKARERWNAFGCWPRSKMNSAGWWWRRRRRLRARC
jgi:F-type H+-transporting ATPase subunit b